MSLGRNYYVKDLGTVYDSVDTFDGLHYYEWTGTLPSWFVPEPFFTGSTQYYPTFSFTPPEGYSGTHLFGVRKLTNAGVVVDTALFQINVDPFNITVHEYKGCYTTNLVWLDPSGGWESYLFVGKQETFQDKGKSSTFTDSDGVKRLHRREDVHQGTIVSTGNVSREHSDFIADLSKSIQAYLWTETGDFVPILIESKDFIKPKSGDPFSRYEIEFRFAEEDVIQTQ